MMKIEYDIEERVWWMEKEEMLSEFVRVLVRNFKETLRSDRKQIFNITLLIRQNFLTLCEAPELMISIFGHPHVEWKNIEDPDDIFYSFPSRLEDEVEEMVKEELGVTDLYEI